MPPQEKKALTQEAGLPNDIYIVASFPRWQEKTPINEFLANLFLKVSGSKLEPSCDRPLSESRTISVLTLCWCEASVSAYFTYVSIFL